MTFVGKILVIVIMAFSLFFLALSTVVLTASTNWKSAYEKQSEASNKLQGQIQDLTTQLGARETELTQEQQLRQSETDSLNSQIAEINNEIEQVRAELSGSLTEKEVAQRTAENLAADAQARAQEAEELRELLLAATKQANDLTAAQTERDEQISNITRQLQTAEETNGDLRELLQSYRNFLQSRGLPSDPDRVRIAAEGVIVSPDITGRVLRVASQNDLLEFSLGDDDGVKMGQEYYVYRTGAESRYVGKVRVTGTDPDRSVAEVIDRYLGSKVREGDYVSGQINPGE